MLVRQNYQCFSVFSVVLQQNIFRMRCSRVVRALCLHLQVPEENIQSVIGALRTESTAQWRKLEETRTTIFKVILFKHLSCPKSAKRLLADYSGSALRRRRDECDGVLGMPLLRNHFLSNPRPWFLRRHPRPPLPAGSSCFSLPNWICFFSSLKLLLPTPWPP